MGAGSASLAWLGFALMTMVSWGTYGVFLHTGQIAMGDPVNGRYKAFLFVGIAYFFVAVLAPLLVLRLNGATWSFPAKGLTWSLIAGAAVFALGEPEIPENSIAERITTTPNPPGIRPTNTMAMSTMRRPVS